MRRLATAALTLALLASLSCRKQRTNETAGVGDTTTTPTTATATTPPESLDTASNPGDFSFDQRQQFVQSIRQQLTDIDRQIRELSAQAKSRGGAVSDRALQRIRASRRTVDQSLTRVNTATAANWDQLKQGVNRSVESLSESIEAAQPK